MTDPGAVTPPGVRHDCPMLGGDVMHPITYSDLEVVERAVRTVRASAVVLPATDLSGFHGFPLIEWSAGLADRLRGGAGPMLDRATLSLWESWPSGVECAPPPAPLRILGFASTASWRHAVRATRALRGFGAGCVLTTTRPSVIRLSEADFAGVYVIQVSHDGANEVLVHGRGGIESASRMVATRYWEERLLAHALRVGAVRRPPWTGQA